MVNAPVHRSASLFARLAAVADRLVTSRRPHFAFQPVPFHAIGDFAFAHLLLLDKSSSSLDHLPRSDATACCGGLRAFYTMREGGTI